MKSVLTTNTNKNEEKVSLYLCPFETDFKTLIDQVTLDCSTFCVSWYLGILVSWYLGKDQVMLSYKNTYHIATTDNIVFIMPFSINQHFYKSAFLSVSSFAA